MKRSTALALAIYAGTIPLANYFIGHIGTQSFLGGPHTIPVGFGYQAPSGVLWIGVALVARDWIQMASGKRLVLAAIAVGVALSYVVKGLQGGMSQVERVRSVTLSLPNPRRASIAKDVSADEEA